MAPEVTLKQPYNEKADIFSLACCIVEVGSCFDESIALRALPDAPRHASWQAQAGYLVDFLSAHASHGLSSLSDALALLTVKRTWLRAAVLQVHRRDHGYRDGRSGRA